MNRYSPIKSKPQGRKVTAILNCPARHTKAVCPLSWSSYVRNQTWRKTGCVYLLVGKIYKVVFWEQEASGSPCSWIYILPKERKWTNLGENKACNVLLSSSQVNEFITKGLAEGACSTEPLHAKGEGGTIPHDDNDFLDEVFGHWTLLVSEYSTVYAISSGPWASFQPPAVQWGAVVRRRDFDVVHSCTSFLCGNTW